MDEPAIPIALTALEVAPRTKHSNYPEPFASRIVGREKRNLGDLFGLANFESILRVSCLVLCQHCVMPILSKMSSSIFCKAFPY
jgi:hypothetical protein